MEIWRQVKGYENYYEISNYGRIRSVTRIVKQRSNRTQTKNGKILKTALHRGGYVFCALSKHNKLKTLFIHRIVAFAFVKNPENKNEINHKDGNKQNNLYTNLEWVTRSENIRHAIKNGLLKYKKGEDHFSSKLSDNERKEMILYRKKGYTLKQISELYPVSLSQVSRIVKNYNNDTT